MPPQTTSPETRLGSFGRILELEESRGFDDKSVYGGLDRFIQHWAAEITAALGDSPQAQELLRISYAPLSPEQRRQWVGQWQSLLSNQPSAVSHGQSAEIPRSESRNPAPEPPPKYRSPRPALTVDAPVHRLGGLGPRLAAKLEKLGVTSVRDLLYHFPRRHQDYSIVGRISELSPGEECTLVGIVWEARAVPIGPGGKKKITEAVMGDETGNIRVIWFDQGYISQKLQPNSRIAVSGKAEVFRNQLVFQPQEYDILDGPHPPLNTGRLVPVYPLTQGLHVRTLRGFTWQALKNWLGGVEEIVPADPLARTGLMPLREAVWQAHYPDDLALWQDARRRLAFDELLTLQLAVLSRRQHWTQGAIGVPVQPDPAVVENFVASLPFSLTAAQRRCMDEILADLKRGTPPMNRLLQGEVGSGKTVVALAGLLAAIAGGYQGSIMAPTEVLAEQHFQTVSRLLGGLSRPVQEPHQFTVYLEPLRRPVAVGLLTGSTATKARRELTQMAAAATLDLLIGTHALIQSTVDMPRLAMAVVDEQHRFGVSQRSALRQKGEEMPHTLAMSATPIPRTLSLTLYGDLDISTIDELPPGRQQILTRWVPPDRRQAAYGFVRKEVQASRQAFVICPLVEESEAIEAKAATEEYQRLSREVFPDLRLGLLHGRMSSREKDRAMRQFRDGELDILVSTAVVEVGIDIANATVMLIEGADHFGLAQLHQFRGRVGRGQHKSYCLMLADAPVSETARERLSALEMTNDGFRLAEIDLELRGPGDFFGTRQSGLPSLRMAQLSDRQLLLMAREEATKLVAQDPDLAAPELQPLATRVARFLDQVSAEVS